MPEDTSLITAAAITPPDMPAPTGPTPSAQEGTAPSGIINPAPAGSTPDSAPTAVIPGTLDDKGHAFDPARHLPRKHPHGGHWLPKGGRKPRAIPVQPAPSFIPDRVPDEKVQATDNPAPPATADHAADAGEVIARATQLTAGVILDAPKETTASASEHKHMVEATAAYIRAKGWQTAAGVGLILMFAAWLLKVLQQPAPQAKVRSWFSGGQPRNVTPEPSASAPRPADNASADLPAGIPPRAPLG